MNRSSIATMLVIALFAGLALMGPVNAGECRMGPNASTSYCGLPNRLGNFQGFYTCNNDVRIGRPSDKTELAKMVAHYLRVKASGIGHSWWGSQFCSGNNSQAINIVTTELNDTLRLIKDPVRYNASAPPPANWPIQVDEQHLTVSVAAGVTLRLLLDYLANYTSARAPAGYTLGSFSFYIDQTVGGAVATGTHGSSFEYGSLSSQVTRLELVLASGTMVNFTKASNPYIWDAVRVAVGRLGVITEVELRIFQQDMLERRVTETSSAGMLSNLLDLQHRYKLAVQASNTTAVAEALAEYEGTQIFWFPLSDQSIWLNYTSLGTTPLQQRAPAEAVLSVASIGSGAPGQAPYSANVSAQQTTLAPGPYLEDVHAQVPSASLTKYPIPATEPQAWNSLQYAFLSGFLLPGNFSRRDGIVSETVYINKASTNTDPYDQYEFSFPLEHAADCLKKVTDAMAEENLAEGMPGPSLIRFVGAEDALLSNANGGARLFWNIEDHQSYQTGQPNRKFDKVVQILRGGGCNARMHWGKAGWEKWANCFDGATEYPKTWCQFGCAVHALDPEGKFRSESDVWTWQARKNGTDVPFESCCTEAGFDNAACSCASRTDCSYVPPQL